MRRTPARRVEPGSALWRGFLASGSSGHDFMRSLSSPRRKVQLPYIIQCIKTAGKLATTSDSDVEVGHRQHPRLTALEPLLCLGGVALRAAAIVAGVVGEHLAVARFAALDLAAEGGIDAPLAERSSAAKRRNTSATSIMTVPPRPVISRSSSVCSDARVGVVRWG